MFYLDFEQLKKTIEENRSRKKLVFTNGCFDILHVGHVRYLQEAKKCGDLLVVGLNTDRSVRELKGPERPIQQEKDRAEILAALASVDYTFLFDDDTPERVIHELQPDVLVKGGDWAIKDIVGSDFVLAKGGEVKSLSFIDGRSTTEVVKKVRSTQSRQD
jgi:D-beta-D-heptose 7-phosphate kinase/D-beta-D-heptose 1-phosphate adenosyltransferase